MSDLLSVGSALVAGLALFVALVSWVDTRRSSRLAQHYELVNGADAMIGTNEDLLRFHGIDPTTIKDRYGVDAAELGYLLQMFNAGSLSHLVRLGEKRRARPFAEGSYWYEILRNECTQQAFPLVQLLFDRHNPFMATCEETIRTVCRRDADPATVDP